MTLINDEIEIENESERKNENFRLREQQKMSKSQYRGKTAIFPQTHRSFSCVYYKMIF